MRKFARTGGMKRSGVEVSTTSDRFAADPVAVVIQTLGIGGNYGKPPLIRDRASLVEWWTGWDACALVWV